jgi:uncharacterized protein
VLLAWAGEPSTLVPAWYGFATVLATLAAFGIAVFGLRDGFAARRMERLIPAAAAELVGALPSRQRVLITGATGFIGCRLTEALAAAGHDVIVLARNPLKAAALRPPFRLVTSLDQIDSATAIDAIVNLAGEPVADGLWTRRKRRRILGSRLRVTRQVMRLIARLERRPAVLISGSGIGWYGLWQDEVLTEFDGGKRCFGHRFCEAWERATKRAARLGTRVVRLRIGLVLSTEGGMLGRLLLPFEFGLGGPIGSGRQWMSWIERDDLIRLIAHAIATPRLTGPVNATAPTPVTNAEFAAELARALHRPGLLRMPAWLLRLVAGGLAKELLIGGQRVIPDKADVSGFVFRHATLASAFAAMFGRDSANAAAASTRASPPPTHNTSGHSARAA